MPLCFCFTHFSVPSPPFSAFPTKCRAWNLGLELLKRRKPWCSVCSVCSVRSVLFTICFVKSPWISKVDIVAPFFSWPQHVQSGSFKLKFHRFLRSSQLPQSAWGQQVNLIPWLMILMLLYSRSLSLSLTRPWRVPRSACQGHCLTNSRSRWSSSGVHGFPSNALNGPRRKLPLASLDQRYQSKGSSDLTAPQDCDQTPKIRWIFLWRYLQILVATDLGNCQDHLPEWTVPTLELSDGPWLKRVMYLSSLRLCSAVMSLKEKHGKRSPSPRATRGTAGIRIMSRGDIEMKSFQCLRRIVTLNLSGIDK